METSVTVTKALTSEHSLRNKINLRGVFFSLYFFLMRLLAASGYVKSQENLLSNQI